MNIEMYKVEEKAIFDAAPAIYEACRALLIENKSIMPVKLYEDIKHAMNMIMCHLPAAPGTMREDIRYKGDAAFALDAALCATAALSRITPVRVRRSFNLNGYITSVWVETGIPSAIYNS